MDECENLSDRQFCICERSEAVQKIIKSDFSKLLKYIESSRVFQRLDCFASLANATLFFVIFIQCFLTIWDRELRHLTYRRRHRFLQIDRVKGFNNHAKT